MPNNPSHETWEFISTTHNKKTTEISPNMIGISAPYIYRFPMESRSEIGGSTLLLQGTYRHLVTKDILQSLPYFHYSYAPFARNVTFCVCKLYNMATSLRHACF